MAKIWITLSSSWKLEDVQAALNVIVSFLSAIGIFTFARYCWQKSTIEVANNRHVPLSKLLSLSSPGEVFDVLNMLRTGLFSEGHLRILAQCAIVLVLSISTILSGPVSRFSTKIGHTILILETPGFLAGDNMNSIGLANVEWNLTMFRLDQAGFPLDQLLDFIPDSAIDWQYVQEEWNNSWTAECDTLPLTLVNLGNANANVSDNSSIWDEIPKVSTLFPPAFQNWSNHDMWLGGDGYYVHGNLFKDTLDFFTSSVYNDSSVNISIVALHTEGIARATDGIAYFNTSKIPYAAYTRITCYLKRSAASMKENNVAFPWTTDQTSISQAYADNYQARFMQQATSNSPVSVPSGEELFRFYQVYMVTKDTLLRRPVVRKISVVVNTVEISALLLAAILALFLFIVIGTANYFYFFRRHTHVARSTPQTKLDWMIHSIKEAERDSAPGPRDSFRGVSPADMYEMPLGTRRSEFASAMYGPSPDADGHGRVSRTSSKGYFELYSSPSLQRTPTEYTGMDPGPSPPSHTRSGTGLGFLDQAGHPIRMTQGYLRMPENDT